MALLFKQQIGEVLWDSTDANLCGCHRTFEQEKGHKENTNKHINAARAQYGYAFFFVALPEKTNQRL